MRMVVYVVRRRKCGHLHGFSPIGVVVAANRHDAQGKAWKCQFRQVAFDFFRWPAMEFPEIVAASMARAEYHQVAERDNDRRLGLPDDCYWGRRIITAENAAKRKARHDGRPQIDWRQQLAIQRSRNLQS